MLKLAEFEGTTPKVRAGKRFYSVSDTAKILGMSRRAVYYWILQDDILAVRLSAASQAPYYIPEDEILRLFPTL